LPPVDVATAWNDTLWNLGIAPVYPPEEDLYVGDVWVVTADAEDRPLIGKGVRIGHINLRDLMVKPADAPVFPDTMPRKKEDEFRQQVEVETNTGGDKEKRLTLSLVGFPGVTIHNSVSASGSERLAGLAAAASRNGNATVEIKIPIAETYGVPVPQAALRLADWCTAPETQHFCTDEFARLAIAYAVSDQVLELDADKGEYKNKFQVRLITRVFMAREIEESRVMEAARGADAALSVDTARTKDGESSTRSEDVVSVAKDAIRSGKAGDSAHPLPELKLATSNNAGSTIEFHQVFQRPVVFGFRSVSFNLTPSSPNVQKSPSAKGAAIGQSKPGNSAKPDVKTGPNAEKPR
jgi:hypothetical protein